MAKVTLPTPLGTEYESAEGSINLTLLWTDFDILDLPHDLAILQDEEDGRILVMPQGRLYGEFTQLPNLNQEEPEFED